MCPRVSRYSTTLRRRNARIRRVASRCKLHVRVAVKFVYRNRYPRVGPPGNRRRGRSRVVERVAGPSIASGKTATIAASRVLLIRYRPETNQTQHRAEILGPPRDNRTGRPDRAPRPAMERAPSVRVAVRRGCLQVAAGATPAQHQETPCCIYRPDLGIGDHEDHQLRNAGKPADE